MGAARPRALDLWMNGLYVGRWERTRSKQDQLRYDPSWLDRPEGRPLSLSLPIGGGTPLRGAAVSAYFENLIPDNEQILRRLRDRFKAHSTAAFDLLAQIGRDCAGAIQLLPAGAEPGDVRRIDARPLDEAGVAAMLREATLGARFGSDDSDAFRLSLAGAQEKTALLRHRGRWCVPRGATPSTHVFKLPLGLVANIRADLSDSVELEWLCLELMRSVGLDTPKAEIGRFEDQRALIVERFDRRRAPDGKWWIRIPQEDFCQATGTPPTGKYEADGGPGIRQILDILRGSESAEDDRVAFFKAQIMFWILGATDGHAKNFSIFLRGGGRYRLTPFYDVLSTYPIQGIGAGRLDPRRARLAMAITGRNRHYLIRDIRRWHWTAMATALGLERPASALIEELILAVPKAMASVGERLPEDFPRACFDAVAVGATAAVRKLASEPDAPGRTARVAR